MSKEVQGAVKAPLTNKEAHSQEVQKPVILQSMDSPAEKILLLQRTIGNNAIGRLLRSGALQAKLKIGHCQDELKRQPAPASIMRKPDGEPPVPMTCDPPQEKGKHPETYSPWIIDRWMGKFATEGDPGEGCREEPYVAGKTEKVCTKGYGIQIPGCLVLSKATGAPPTEEEKAKVKASEPPEFMCACAGKEHVDCKGPQAEAELRKVANPKVKYVHDVVPVDLDQAQFDALVDISMHRGSIPPDLLESIKKYWCTDAGKDYVRAVYQESALTPFPKAFAARRKFRVWPPSLTGLSTRGEGVLIEAGKLREQPGTSQKSSREVLDELFSVVGSIEQHQKRGFRNEEERNSILILKKKLLQEVSALMDAMSGGTI